MAGWSSAITPLQRKARGPVSKKKATGMSKRVSFMDRSVVAENREIMKFNEALEREARREEAKRNGVPFEEDEPRARPASAGARGRPASRPSGGPAKPRREPVERGPRPGEAELIAAGEAAEGWADFQAAGRKMADQLLRGRKPNPAARFAWELVVAAKPADADWEDVRRRWGTVHDAILAEWVKTHPEDAPPPPKKKPKPRPARRPGGGAPKPGDEAADAAAGAGETSRRRRGGRGRRPNGAAGAAPAAGETEASVGAVTDVSGEDPPLLGDAAPAAALGTSEEMAPPSNPSAPPEQSEQSEQSDRPMDAGPGHVDESADAARTSVVARHPEVAVDAGQAEGAPTVATSESATDAVPAGDPTPPGPVQSEPAPSEPVPSEPEPSEAVQPEPVQPEPVQPEPVQPEPVQPEAEQTEAEQTEAEQTEAVQPEPAHKEASATDAAPPYGGGDRHGS